MDDFFLHMVDNHGKKKAESAIVQMILDIKRNNLRKLGAVQGFLVFEIKNDKSDRPDQW
jgi:hypothetical protein